MRTKSLRELQIKGEKAISAVPVLLTNRKGPVGVLIPVTADSLPRIQAEAEKWMAMESLKQTWALARDLHLDRMTSEEIDDEVKAVRKKRIQKK